MIEICLEVARLKEGKINFTVYDLNNKKKYA